VWDGFEALDELDLQTSMTSGTMCVMSDLFFTFGESQRKLRAETQFFRFDFERP